MPRNLNKKDYSIGLPLNFNSFSIIEDPRTGGNKKHYFGEILFMVVSGLLCGIENQCHWVLDTCFREDHNQTRVGNAAKNMGAARRIVLNILKADKTLDKTLDKSLPKKRFHALLDVTYRENLPCLSLA